MPIGKLDKFQLFHIGAIARVDWRTVRAYLAGKPTRPATAKVVDDAMRQLGFVAPTAGGAQ